MGNAVRVSQANDPGSWRDCDRLPLPSDVGEALSEYLRDARPNVPVRQVFLAQKARADKQGDLDVGTGRRARVRGKLRVDADFALLAAATNLARLATLKAGSISGAGWAVAG